MCMSEHVESAESPGRIAVDADDRLVSRVYLAGGHEEGAVPTRRDDDVGPVDVAVRVVEAVHQTRLDAILPGTQQNESNMKGSAGAIYWVSRGTLAVSIQFLFSLRIILSLLALKAFDRDIDWHF